MSSPAAIGARRRILVVRRDNIGDLLCTTPLLHALRARHPDAYLAVLVSSYNFDVLMNNGDIDEVFVFLKRQQKSHGYGQLASLWHRWRLMRKLRRLSFDDVILANGGWRYARRIGGARMIGFRERDNSDRDQPEVVVPLANGAALHEVEKLAHLGRVLDVDPDLALGPLKLHPSPEAISAAAAALSARGWQPDLQTIGIHISSRRPIQRWPTDAFGEFMAAVHRSHSCQFLLFWAPGAENDPMHPGDDEKAAALLDRCPELPAFACPTNRVRDLVASMALCQQIVCSDGGAMHVAAALGKPVLCFFGDSKAAEWHPWRVPHVLLQPPDRRVPSITVEEALGGWLRLQDLVGADPRRDGAHR